MVLIRNCNINSRGGTFMLQNLIKSSLLFCLISGNLFAGSFQLMSFNVENLFDNEHDPEHLDWEYLPKSHPLKRRGCQTISNNHF